MQTFNGHCYALKTGLEYMTFDILGPVPDPLKGTKSMGLRPCASGGLAPQGARRALTDLMRFQEEG